MTVYLWATVPIFALSIIGHAWRLMRNDFMCSKGEQVFGLISESMILAYGVALLVGMR